MIDGATKISSIILFQNLDLFWFQRKKQFLHTGLYRRSWELPKPRLEIVHPADLSNVLSQKIHTCGDESHEDRASLVVLRTVATK